MIKTELEQRIKDSIDFADTLSLLKSISRNSTPKRQRVFCPKCGSDECFAFDNSGTDKPHIVKCFSCNEAWDTIGLAQFCLNLNYHDTLKYFAEIHHLDYLFEKSKPNLAIPVQVKVKPPIKVEVKQEYIPLEKIEECADMWLETTLAKYLVEVLGFAREKVEEAGLAYGAGGIKRETWTDKFPVVFPFADDKGRVYDAKVLAFKADGHRVKYVDREGKEQALMSTLKTILELSRESSEARPLFGTHLSFEREKYQYVCVVESEKTAIIMSILMTDVLFLAAGSMDWISRNNIAVKLTPFADCKIRLLPDRNAVEKWEEVAAAARKAGFDCLSCSKVIEYFFHRKEQYRCDILDAVEDILLSPELKKIGKAMQRSLVTDLKTRLRQAFSFKAQNNP